MNTPIIKISDDQNEITHENGVVTVFEEVGRILCVGCIYYNTLSRSNCMSNQLHCISDYRKDKRNGIFKLK